MSLWEKNVCYNDIMQRLIQKPSRGREQQLPLVGGFLCNQNNNIAAGRTRMFSAAFLFSEYNFTSER